MRTRVQSATRPGRLRACLARAVRGEWSRRDGRLHQNLIFTDLAKEHKAGLVPFFFEGFADKREYYQPDNLHPTAAAQPILLENVWKALKPMLR